MENGQTNVAVDFIGQIAELINTYGWLTIILIVTAYIVYRNWSVIIKWAGDVASGSVRSVIYKEQIDQLKHDLDEERQACDRKMAEMRKDYEDKISGLEGKLEEMNEKILNLSVELGKLSEKLEAAQVAAKKAYSESGISLRKRSSNGNGKDD